MKGGLFCFFVLMALCSGSAGDLAAESLLKVDTLDDVGIRKLIASSDRLVLVAMAAWCVPCREELPVLNEMYDKYKKRGLTVVGISLDMEGPSAIEPIIRKAKVRFPVFWGGEKPITDYNIYAIPMILFARDGKIIDRVVGKQSRKNLEEKIRGFLNGKGGAK